MDNGIIMHLCLGMRKHLLLKLEILQELANLHDFIYVYVLLFT
jgi:hypothetical protein